MTRCHRCRVWKPDACFRLNGRWGAETSSECTQCRAPRAVMKSAVYAPSPQPIKPSARAEDLIMIARIEREKFERRGSPTIPRPYVHFFTGELIPKRAGAYASSSS